MCLWMTVRGLHERKRGDTKPSQGYSLQCSE